MVVFPPPDVLFPVPGFVVSVVLVVFDELLVLVVFVFGSSFGFSTSLALVCISHISVIFSPVEVDLPFKGVHNFNCSFGIVEP